MTGAERLAQAIHRAVGVQKDPVDFGVATVAKNSGVASVTGLAVEAMWIDKTQWHSHFAAEVAAAGGAITSRRVIVLFKGGQATILGTTGA